MPDRRNRLGPITCLELIGQEEDADVITDGIKAAARQASTAGTDNAAALGYVKLIKY